MKQLRMLMRERFSASGVGAGEAEGRDCQAGQEAEEMGEVRAMESVSLKNLNKVQASITGIDYYSRRELDIDSGQSLLVCITYELRGGKQESRANIYGIPT